jgi:serine/threonine-protein kinase
MEVSDRDLTGQLVDRRFRVAGQLGSGGMGTVWRVQHTTSLQWLALKTLDPSYAKMPEATERFLREARAAGTLRSRHVVRIVDADMSYRHDGEPLPYLVMELLEGRTLQQALDGSGRIDPGQLTWMARQLARALDAAHRQGIVHRDLKPSNVFLARDEENEPIVKLCDFGIAKLIDATELAAGAGDLVTRTGAMMGTPLYLAPEILRNAGQAVPATDQWSLGLIAFRALAGREYFASKRNLTALVLAIANDPMPAPSQLDPAMPGGFDAWFARACARAPDQRFPDVPAQVAALEVALRHPEPVPLSPDANRAPELARPATPPGARRGAGAGSRWGRAYVTLACVWAAVSLAWLSTRAHRAPAAERSAVTAATAAVTAAAAAPPPVAAPPAVAAPAPIAAPAPAATPIETPPPVTAVAVPEAPPPPRPRPTRPHRPTPTAPAAVSEPRRLARGEPCHRSAQCASGLCVAETCQ